MNEVTLRDNYIIITNRGTVTVLSYSHKVLFQGTYTGLSSNCGAGFLSVICNTYSANYISRQYDVTFYPLLNDVCLTVMKHLSVSYLLLSGVAVSYILNMPDSYPYKSFFKGTKILGYLP